MDVNTMTRDEAVDRMQEIHERMERMAAKHRMSNRDEHDFVDLKDEFDELHRHAEKLDRAAGIAAAVRAPAPKLRVERGGVSDDSDERRSRVQRRDAAMRTVDGLVRDNRLPARAAEIVEGFTKSGSGLQQSHTQRMIEALGDDDYLRAFCKLMADPDRGHLMWDGKEHQAFRRVQELRGETRAMGETDTAGGFMIPLTLDPSILLTSAGSINPLRQISRVVQIATDSWNGVTSAGVTAHWLDEAAEVSDDSPSLAQPHIPVYKAAAFIPFSFEIQQDAINFVPEIAKLLTDGLDQLNATAYTTGSGTGQPTGLITSLVGGSSSVATATADTLVAGDVYGLQNALPPRFQAGARWAANLSILNTWRQFQTVNGSLTFPALQNDPPTLLGRPVHEISNMDGTLGGGAGNDYVALYGDFSNFVIVDRWPSSLEIIPHLFGANRRPTGQRGAFLYARTGSDSANDNAFRMLVA
jgi:HK97 family phage major capsid protein